MRSSFVLSRGGSSPSIPPNRKPSKFAASCGEIDCSARGSSRHILDFEGSVLEAMSVSTDSDSALKVLHEGECEGELQLELDMRLFDREATEREERLVKYTSFEMAVGA